METVPPSLFVIISCMVLLVVAGGILSMLKTALTSVRKPLLSSLIEAGEEKYLPVLEAAEKPEHYLTSLRIGIMFLEILSGCLGGFCLSAQLGALLLSSGLSASAAWVLSVIITATGVMTVFFIFGEVIPRQIALAFPEKLCPALLPLIRLVQPAVFLHLLISRGLSALIKAGISRQGITEAELRHTLLESEKSGVVESEERTMVEGVFYLGDRPVSAFMTHRSEIIWLDMDADPEEARTAAENSEGQLYFPVAGGDLDKVVGIVSIQDIYRALLNASWPGLKTVMRTPYFIPETMSALKAFESFKKVNSSYLFVMDEYGGFSGMLTVRNLVEEIVGELSASGAGEEVIEKQEDGSWLADGGVNIDDAARELGLTRLGSSDYHTLAGFILYLAGEIPRTGAHFDYSGYRFKITDMDGNRIDKIMISTLKTGK